MKKVLALATCYNRKEKTLKAINSLVSGNKDIDFSFIICDDNSSDGTYEELQKINNVEVIKGNGSLYWCGGMRKAIETALNKKENYDYCLWFNDDVDFYSHSIEELVSKDSECVWVGPTCDSNGTLSYGGVIKTSSWRPKYKTIIGNDSQRTICDSFNANCVLIPWNIFKKSGNMDPVYTHQFGDYDYGFNLTKNGVQIRVSDEYVGVCNTNNSDGTFNDTELSVIERLERKKKPKGGLPFNEYFHFLNKNYSFFTAVVFSTTPYIRILLRK